MDRKITMALVLMSIAVLSVAASAIASAEMTSATHRVDVPLSDDTYNAIAAAAGKSSTTAEQLIADKSSAMLEKEYLDGLRGSVVRAAYAAYNAKDVDKLKAMQECVGKA